jgi:hypothetical protein
MNPISSPEPSLSSRASEGLLKPSFSARRTASRFLKTAPLMTCSLRVRLKRSATPLVSDPAMTLKQPLPSQRPLRGVDSSDG